MMMRIAMLSSMKAASQLELDGLPLRERRRGASMSCARCVSVSLALALLVLLVARVRIEPRRCINCTSSC